MSTTTWDHDAFLAGRMRNDLDAMFRAVLPAQWVEPAVAAALSESSPLITPAAHTAALKKEVDRAAWWIEKCQAAERQVFRLREALDMTSCQRVDSVRALVRDQYPSRTAKHDEQCHLRHAACLAKRVREALNGGEAS